MKFWPFKTRLLISRRDIPRAYLELDDATLGKFARQILIYSERAVEKESERRSMPLEQARIMHSAVSLAQFTHGQDSPKFEWEGEEITCSLGPIGDWRITVERIDRPR